MHVRKPKIGVNLIKVNFPGYEPNKLFVHIAQIIYLLYYRFIFGSGTTVMFRRFMTKFMQMLILLKKRVESPKCLDQQQLIILTIKLELQTHTFIKNKLSCRVCCVSA